MVTILEKIGHFQDREVQRLFNQLKIAGKKNDEISDINAETLNIRDVLSGASKTWDGGYTVAGIMGHGDAFITRDPWGIRPAFYYHDDEIVVAASERAVIQIVERTFLVAINPSRKNSKPIAQIGGYFFSQRNSANRLAEFFIAFD